MKKLSTYLFLILFSFSAPSFAGDIRDYQIEGMSVGDSLLDHFSEKEIKKFKKIPTHWRFNGITISSPNFKIYHQVNVLFYPRSYIISILDAKIYYQNDINECYKKMNEIVDEFSKTFSNLKKYKKSTETISNKGINYKITYVHFGGEVQGMDSYHSQINDGATVSCLDFTAESEFTDHLIVDIAKKWIR